MGVKLHSKLCTYLYISILLCCSPLLQFKSPIQCFNNNKCCKEWMDDVRTWGNIILMPSSDENWTICISDNSNNDLVQWTVVSGLIFSVHEMVCTHCVQFGMWSRVNASCCFQAMVKVLIEKESFAPQPSDEPVPWYEGHTNATHAKETLVNFWNGFSFCHDV